MSIITQDSKVLVNASGEVLKLAPIIDISSTYGVTKDGSNLVSAVKNRNTANVFRQSNASYKPTENGDGFDFGVNVLKELIGNTVNKTYTKWEVEWECKLSTTQQAFDVVMSADSASVRGFGFTYTGATIYVLRNGATIGSQLFGHTYSELTVRHKINIKGNGVSFKITLNDIYEWVVTNPCDLSTNGNPFNIGGFFFNPSTFSFGGTLYSLKFYGE